jgi:hypothetical protein
MCCIVPKVDLSLFYQIKKHTKTTVMKKLVNNLQIFAMIALIPAITIAYLHTDKATTEEETEKTEIVRKGINIQDAASMIHLVKSF